MNNNTPAAQELAQNHTVAQLRNMINDEFGKQAPSKLRKLEMAQYLDDLRANEQAANALPGGRVAELSAEDQLARDGYAPSVGEPQVFQGAMHEHADVVADTFRTLAGNAHGVAQAMTGLTPAMRVAAKALGSVAYDGLVAIVQSMGRTVRGKVVDTVLREEQVTEMRRSLCVGTGRVLLVVEHPKAAPGRAATRTLHRLVDVEFEPLAS